MITYKNVLDSNNGVKMVRVFSEGRFVGTIERAASNFWRYVPDGNKRLAGPLFESAAKVKKTLEGECGRVRLQNQRNEGSEMAMIDTTNRQIVGMQGELITVQRPAQRMTADEALVHAAYLVSLAEPFATADFKDVLDAIQNT